MSQTPTINQYLLDLFTTAQLVAAQKTKNAKTIALAEKQYKDLSESEVVFGKFTTDAKTGKNAVKVTAKSRGNWSANITFNTGTLAGLCRKNQQGAAKISALDMASIPGLFYVQENDAYYLAVEKDSNIFEGLKLTGYEFPADSFVPTIYGNVDKETKTYGHVDIEHPIVVGRFRIYYINQNKKDKSDQSSSSQDVKLETKGDTQVTSENTQNVPQSNEGDQANPGSTQRELKTPAQPGPSENGNGGQSNSADNTQNPVEVAQENEQEAKENVEEQKEQLGTKKDK